VILVSEDATLADALRGFAWRKLFVSRRDAWRDTCAVVPFGHALLEKLVQPYKSVTAHAWWIRRRRRRRSPGSTAAGGVTGRCGAGASQGWPRFAPLPVMGMPGWCDENAAPVSTTPACSGPDAGRQCRGGLTGAHRC
jgi:hypothetical protein